MKPFLHSFRCPTISALFTTKPLNWKKNFTDFWGLLRNLETRQVAIYYAYLSTRYSSRDKCHWFEKLCLTKMFSHREKTIKPHPFCFELFRPHIPTNVWRRARATGYRDSTLMRVSLEYKSQQIKSVWFTWTKNEIKKTHRCDIHWVKIVSMHHAKIFPPFLNTLELRGAIAPLF